MLAASNAADDLPTTSCFFFLCPFFHHFLFFFKLTFFCADVVYLASEIEFVSQVKRPPALVFEVPQLKRASNLPSLLPTFQVPNLQLPFNFPPASVLLTSIQVVVKKETTQEPKTTLRRGGALRDRHEVHRCSSSGETALPFATSTKEQGRNVAPATSQRQKRRGGN